MTHGGVRQVTLQTQRALSNISYKVSSSADDDAGQQMEASLVTPFPGQSSTDWRGGGTLCAQFSAPGSPHRLIHRAGHVHRGDFKRMRAGPGQNHNQMQIFI